MLRIHNRQNRVVGRRRRAARGGVLVGAAMLLVALGVWMAAMPVLPRAAALSQIERQFDQEGVMAAMSVLEAGRALMFYNNVQTFQNFAGETIDLPAQYDLVNGYLTEVEVLENDGTEPDVQTMQARAWKELDDGTVTRQYIIQQKVELVRLTEYNFASTNFNGPFGEIYPRHWYGKVYLSSPDDELWPFKDDAWTDAQFYHGEVISLEFQDGEGGEGNEQSNHYFVKPGLAGDDLSHMYTAEEVEDLNLHTEFASHTEMPGLPDILAIDDELEPGGAIYDTANDNGTIYNGNHEVFLSPNGEIWLRDFGEGPDDWEVMLDAGGQPVDQHEATILFDGNITLRGFVTGRALIASTGTTIINGNIRNLDFTGAHLGLIAPEAIYFENREVYEDGDENDAIRRPRPINYSDTGFGGATTGSETASASADDGTLNGTAIDPATFNFIAKPVFSASRWANIESGLDDLGVTDPDVLNTIVVPTVETYQEAVSSGGTVSIPGRMPRNGANVDASMASGWYITPCYATVGGDNDHHYYTGGGDFTVRGTYANGIGIDYMATWSKSGGQMTYEVHPFQEVTAPEAFLPVVNEYPNVVPGSWQIIEGD